MYFEKSVFLKKDIYNFLALFPGAFQRLGTVAYLHEQPVAPWRLENQLDIIICA